MGAATINQLLFTIGYGSFVFILCFLLFGYVNKRQHLFIAPRASARPLHVIYNPHAVSSKQKKKKKKIQKKKIQNLQNNNINIKKTKVDPNINSAVVNDNKNDHDDDDHDDKDNDCIDDIQYRGNPIYGWIYWTLSLNYDTMLRGIPGTGTRNDGKDGVLLNITLDGIVLLRFHSLGLRISIVATIIYLCILLPIYSSAECFWWYDNDNNNNNSTTQPPLQLQRSCTVYSDTIIANVTAIKAPPDNYSRMTILNVPMQHHTVSNDFTYNSISHWLAKSSSIDEFNDLKLYTVIIMFYFVLLYTFTQLHNEWISILALRRVYFLEYDVYGERKQQLQSLSKLNDITKGSTNTNNTDNNTVDVTSSKQVREQVSNESHLYNRQPFIPHPESRETIPNVSLYSVLVGGLPSLPKHASSTVYDPLHDHQTTNKNNNDNSNDGTIQQQHSESELKNWQLQTTVKFFDQCVPNQPGYSSSVAAVTIIPGADNMKKAWKKWSKAAGTLRRLRFLHQLILQKTIEQEKQQQQQQVQHEIMLKDGTITNVVIDKDNDEIYVPQEVVDALADNLPIDTTSSAYLSSPQYPNTLGIEDIELGLDEQSRKGQATISDTPLPPITYPTQIDQSHTLMTDIDTKNTTTESISERPKPIRGPSYYSQMLEMLNLHVNTNANKNNGQPNVNNVNNDINDNNVVEMNMTKLLDEATIFGPEQSAVYSREFTQAASGCCPNGFCLERKVYKLSLERLIEMKQQAEVDMVTAYNELKKARTVIAHTYDPSNVMNKKTVNQGNIVQSDPIVSNIQTASTADQNHDSKIIFDVNEEEEKIDEDRVPESGDSTNVPATKRELSTLPSISSTIFPWSKVEHIVNESILNRSGNSRALSSGILSSGVWRYPNMKDYMNTMWYRIRQKAETAANELAYDSTYAIITFTSRQAAVAARACVADGRGLNQWLTLHDIPIPPLADAPAGDMGFTGCRNCCHPVTLSLNEQQKIFRSYFCYILLAFIYVFYTVPLTLATQIVSPDTLREIFPGLAQVHFFKVANIMSGALTATIWSTFFATCPSMFRAIANFGSKATSVAQAEFSALHYFWWFMVFTAFSGNILASMGLKAFVYGIDVANDFKYTLVMIGTTIPTVTAVSWLNWIIMRVLVILPLNYLLQFTSFLYNILGLPCLSRAMRGGGPGGPVPYRIYIDSGMVFLCLHALAPVVPIVAPVCLLYFLFIQPLLRRNLIFVYRPNFDGGGHRWPFIFTVCISSLIVGEILLSVQMALKQATGPFILSAISILPTILFSSEMHRRYYRSFADAALCQTSMLDGWYDDSRFTFKHREQFRQFLVDAHKASYVPVCLASPAMEDFLTAEPAVVIPKDTEEKQCMSSVPIETGINKNNNVSGVDPDVSKSIVRGSVRRQQQQQHGATFRRSSTILQGLSRTNISSNTNSKVGNGCYIELEPLLKQPNSTTGRLSAVSTKSD